MSNIKLPHELVEKIKEFSVINEHFKNFCDKTNLATITNEDIRRIYNHLGSLLLQPQYTVEVVLHFRKELLNILLSAVDFEQSSYSYEEHVKICVALAKIVEIHPDVECFVFKYFEKYPAPFDQYGKNYPAKKKSRVDANLETNITDLDIASACYSFLQHSADFFKSRWSWASFVDKYHNHECDMVKWLCYQCIRITTGMNETQFHKLANKNLSEETIRKCTIEYEFIKSKKSNGEVRSNTKTVSEEETILEISKDVVCVSGIYLPVHKEVSSSNEHRLVEVESTQSNLRKVALGIAANKAVCLQGPVGSGKTYLVEYLAAKTGRVLGESFIKVQLGDQTDSKMLLGTYRCTDIPGEFVWQPGVLTQAVMEGCWLLLEDIDLANMDIASVLTALLENGSLTVPGYRDSLPVSPGFKLFLTQRLIKTVTGFHKKLTNAVTLLEKNVLQINIDPLLPLELQHIIQEIYPPLKTIASRMVDTFLLFSSNSIRGSRLVSTRDLFKWCSRAAIDFDVTSQNSALNVLQDAIDIFCCAYSNLDDRLKLAGEISTHLGIISEKADYFCNRYKPNLCLTMDSLKTSRVSLPKHISESDSRMNFCFTRPSACLLERIMCCVSVKEPVLLVGETGTGKTSAVQYLAHTIGLRLVVINMNQQSDSADLLGGYKPVDMKFIIAPIRREFEDVFCGFFSVTHNRKFLSNIEYCFNEQKWNFLIKLMKKSCETALKRLTDVEEYESVMLGSKRTLKSKKQSKSAFGEKEERDAHFLKRWKDIGAKLQKLEMQLKHKNALAFSFIEGSLVKAVQNGHWVLLDEINLANAETLECLSGLLEGTEGTLSLLERGDKRPIKRHPQFTLFACMNPSTDVGKRDLPAGLRNRFTEFFVDELTDKHDLLLLVDSYLNAMSLPKEKLENIVKFYLNIRKEAQLSLCDGLGHKPHFSLRTLCRALMVAARNPCGVFNRSLFEAFCLSFLTQLDTKSYKIVENLIARYILGNTKDAKSVLKQPIPKPKPEGSAHDYLEFENYWVSIGHLQPEAPDNYILTESVRRNLKDLVRVVSIGKSPVLLQGDTSVGKTSLITYLAKSSGNKCVRINNHEHTDLQEYIGSYVADVNGKLVFREGLLVEAMRKGHWIILDELNLAPTDVLEALNRVLDDNRELFIPETQETVKAHPNFMLFATQNPPGLYGGRKMLSRAFRNRFVELHFNEIPPPELEFILHKRCAVPPSYSKKMVAVMTDLQTRRRGSAAFAGKQGFITLRDLFRWGERYRLAQNTKSLYDWDQHLADEGYLLLAGRVRKVEERNEITEVLQKHMKREVLPYNLFTLEEKTSTVTKHILEKLHKNKDRYKNIVWTFNMRQLAVLVAKALEFCEPVLLVGETGGGKTTVCQLLAKNDHQDLFTVNCHMHTESSDFIGGLRPVRDHVDDDLNRLFEWVDGPLIQAMVKGGIFLADEISLADDSVLERLNSLLEPERSLLLAEKGIDLNNSDNSELIVAHENFHFIGTMNPGGDYGKKELSPALRNRFTEIWCESCTNRNDLVEIIEQNIESGISMGNQEDGFSGFGRCIMDFIEWFKKTEIGKRFTMSIRDILTWVNFINVSVDKVDIADAYLHGACLTFLDSFGSGITSTESSTSLDNFQLQCIDYLRSQLASLNLESTSLLTKNLQVELTSNTFGIKPFHLKLGCASNESSKFIFDAPTCAFNTLRLLRGLQLNKAILLEGSPGVGKTSLVTALAKCTRNQILRINLSDQTDISDLFGADLPVEGGTGGQFAWRDGPFLQALKKGHWILLDELNLASQSVLEGLNACLDHRGEIFIPELGKTFHVKPGTRLFGCQNPLKQGGSRRGLPQSFLNRFTQVYINPLTDKDLLSILTTQFASLPSSMIARMVEFNSRIVVELDQHSFGHRGAPWEFNLRDVTRWCEATLNSGHIDEYKPENVMQLIYSDRMRTVNDKRRMQDVFVDVFGSSVAGVAPVVYVTESVVHIGDVCLNREVSGVNASVLKQDHTCLVLRRQIPVLRSLAYCVNLNWMAILVGSSGTGKSSVVRTLASLVGKTLHTLPVTSAMDTTDILGGFEQADYTRHLEEAARRTENLLLQTVQECMIKGAHQEGAQVLRKWEKFSALLRKETETRTMAEETQFFLKKLENLDEIWNYLLSHKAATPEVEHNLKCLKEGGQTLVQAVVKEGNLNAGGKFEWVDSVLIKCLQDGSWLLIDNVNLCSPAVLDRLNALLEPNGVLIIGERGVKENGEMVEIKPHKDFRLFLTMDPKNGEISRAMRNRGIEICMLNENESGTMNWFDVKSLVSQAGLKDNMHIEALLKMHSFMSSITLGEKPSINHLLQASFLISQQLLRGANAFIAFNYAIVDVYYKSRSPNEFESNDALNLIEGELQNALSGELQVQLYNSNVTQKTLGLSANSHIEKIKQQSALLMETSEKSSLKHLLINCYEITSSKDLSMRFMYLQKYFDNTVLDKVSKKCYEVFLENSADDNGELPRDFHWLPDSIFKTDAGLNNANKICLLLYFISNIALNDSELKEDSPKSKGMTLQRFLKGVKSKETEGKIDDILENDLLNVLDAFDQFFMQILHIDGLQISDKEVITVISFLQWRFILHRLTKINIQEVSLSEYRDIFENLHVHYRWFYKFSVKQLINVLGTKTDSSLSIFINRINSTTTHDFSLLKKLAKAFQKNISKPPPLINEKQVEVYGEFQKISQSFDLCNMQNDFAKILKILLNDQKLRSTLIDTKADLTFEISEAPESFSLLKELYDKYIVDKEGHNKPKKSTVEILPILDHFARLAVNALKSQAATTKENGQILKNTITVPPNLLGVLEHYSRTQDVRLRHELRSDIFYYLLNPASVAPFKFHDFEADTVADTETEPLSHFTPVLSYLIANLLISDTGNKEVLKVTRFGEYRDVTDQHRLLNMLLWHNLQQISSESYDFVHCETKYISKTYTEFIQQLSHTLNITQSSKNPDIIELTEMCIAQIKKAYKSSDIDDVRNDENTLTTLLKQCLEEVGKLNHEGLLSEKLHSISNAHFLMSYLKALFNSKLPMIDPLAKVKLKKQYCLQEIEDLACMSRSYELQNKVYSGSRETLHSYVAVIDEKIKALRERDAEFGKYVAVRPQNVTYNFMSKELLHHFAMVLSPKQIMKLFTDLNDYYSIIQDAINNKATINTQGYEKCAREALQYCYSYMNLIEILRKYRCSYPDIIEPLLNNITEFLYAVRLKTNLHYKLLAEYNNLKSEVDLNKDLVSIIQFPALNVKQPDFLKVIALYTDERIQEFIKRTLQSDNDQQLHKRENFRLLKCGIQEMYNVCIVDGKSSKKFNRELFSEFDALLKVFVAAWKQQEEELERKRKEEESLYKIKPKSEDQEVEDHYNELFPSFHDKDFSDLQVKALEDDKPESSQEASGHYVGVITMEDVRFVSQIHTQLLQLYTKTEWLNPQKKNIECDYITPLVQKCKLFKLLLNKYSECLDYTMDAEILGSLNVLIAVAQRFGDTKSLGEQIIDSPRSQMKKRHNFYKDPQVEEVKGSYHILEELRLRIVELLNEWPEHPTLQTIQTVILRIYDFDMTSPLSRFLTGFEILLSKCHDWEQNAHAGVSLSQYTQNLIHQIIAWRKIEMSMWKDSLNNAFDRMNEPISKWWFYIYAVMVQFIQEHSFTSEELVTTLQNFITQSNLAEFESRLDLMLTFHCHAVHLERTENSQLFVNVLWNVHEYFKQFIPNVETKIKELRAPIEKKLKEYVKIVKWKDISYWAVKETVEKTHKTLHKHIREFEDILKQSVAPCLTNMGPQIKQIENVGIWDRPQRQSPKTYHYTMDPATYMAKRSLSKKIQPNVNEPSETEQSVLTKAEKYFYKSRVLCKDAVLATSYPSLIQSLDGFVTDVIEASSRLQNLEVDTALPKEKQKSQAKGILQQKRKALADLFKTLSSIGLSFRTGIVQSKLKSTSAQFLMKPIDLVAAFEHLNYSRYDEKLLTIWDGCEMYYRKAQMRLDVLELSLRNPAKDLGIQNLERCKGFSGHLMNLVQDQKSELIETSRIFYYLRFYSICLTTICEEPHHLSVATYKSVKQFLNNTLIVMEQCKIILQTCPDEVTLGSELHSVPVLKSENDNFICYKQDNRWKDCTEQISAIASTSRKLLTNLEKFSASLPSTDFELASPNHIMIPDTNGVITELQNISSKLTKLNAVFGDIPLMSSVAWLRDEAKKVEAGCTETTEVEPAPPNLEKFKNCTEKLLEKILVVVQNIYKKHKANENPESKDEENQEEIAELKTDHLKTLVVDELSKDVDVLEMRNVLKHLHNVVAEFYSIKSSKTAEFKTVLSQILPLLEQLILLCQYFVTQQVSAYRVTCKMSSILSNIFIELATKGFCVPPEFSDELNSEGQSQQAGGGMGLGEGEGERDVSDKIESEDQLEDAQPAGQEKQKQDDKDCKEEDKGIEMSEDFEGKMQDVEKGEEDDDDKSDSNEDAEEQMGETEKGADQLDQQIWGSDDEEAAESGDEQEHNEEKGSKGEKEGQDELAAREDDKPSEEDQNDPSADDSKEKSKKDINEMEEPEYDDEQVDPYHGNHPEYPEPEPMDLPEDLALDDDMQDKDEAQDEKNPFDIDAMKEQMPPPEDDQAEDGNKNEEEEKQNLENDSDASDNELEDQENKESALETAEAEEEQDPEGEDNKNIKDPSEKTEENEEKKDSNESALDQTQAKEDVSEAMEVDDIEAADNVQTNPSENQKATLPNEEVCQEDNPDKEGVGQSRMEQSKTGHKGEASAQEEMSSNRQEEEEREMRRKPGESDSKRSLGNVSESVKKKLKTIDVQQDEEGELDEDDAAKQKQTAEMYQHIKEAKESDDQILDTATKEQADEQKEVPNLEDEKAEDAKESSDSLPKDQEEEESVDVSETAKQKAERLESEKRRVDRGQHPEGEVLEELQDVEIEGDIIETATVPRGGETSHHTQYSSLTDSAIPQLSIQEINLIRTEVEEQLSAWNEPPTSMEAEQAWEKISSMTSSLAQGLSEQLRLVLEPTQASRLKGDYRTGRRINMRKVIPYIASQFRKDKIWLRRTKPSKREYQIALAIDDSSSMSDNHSKELAFESVALISKALTLLESGQLSVLSFGESTEVLHKLTDTFTEKSGSKLLQKFQFTQKKTCVAKLVDFSTEMLNSAHSHTNALIAKLLIIVSDGRGIFSEGETYVQQAVRRAKLSNIFMVFVIVDNPENKDSILDIRMPIFKDGKLLGIKSYMDSFPFPFYIILRDINSLPSVLSDALRQWFEIVSNVDKQ